MGKCVWLMCKQNHPTQAEYGCSEHFGTLVSLNETSVTRIGEYLNHIRARSLEITKVSHTSILVDFVISGIRTTVNRRGSVQVTS